MTLEKLMKKYGVNTQWMMLIASLDGYSWKEIGDLEFLEERIQTHLENIPKNYFK